MVTYSSTSDIKSRTFWLEYIRSQYPSPVTMRNTALILNSFGCFWSQPLMCFVVLEIWSLKYKCIDYCETVTCNNNNFICNKACNRVIMVGWLRKQSELKRWGKTLRTCLNKKCFAIPFSFCIFLCQLGSVRENSLQQCFFLQAFFPCLPIFIR